MSSENQYLSVFQFNHKMKRFFNKESSFKQIHVKGEVSGTSISSSRHLYFNLKDKRSSVPCVVYKSVRKRIGFEIKDGMELLVIADVNVYVPHGKYQLDVVEAAEDGLGKLYVKYLQLKEKLEKEGLFSDEFKKELPEFPKRIGVVTSKEGSVIHDILRTIGNHWPYCQIFLFPSQVQGASATKQMIAQIKRADDFGLDVLIIARGGGSIEDLWCFNDETLARTVFNCKTPVISGIGHEGDTTLCDFVSDVSASTPTMAATMAINDRKKISEKINGYNIRLLTFMSARIEDYKKQYGYMLSRPLFTDANYVCRNKNEYFNKLRTRFQYCSSEIINSRKNMLSKIKSEYVIRHPCKMQFNSSRAKLNELKTRLIDAIYSIIKTNRHNLDNTADEFKFYSDKFLSNQNFRLDNIKTSYVIQNPCKIQMDDANSKLSLCKEDIVKLTSIKLENCRKDFDTISNSSVFKNPLIIFKDKSQKLSNTTNQFLNRSNEIVLINSHRLDLVKRSPVIKNPHTLYESKLNNLNEIRMKNVIKNPCKIQFDKSVSDLSSSKDSIIRLSSEKIQSSRKNFDIILNSRIFKSPDLIYEDKSQELSGLTNRFVNKSNEILLRDSHRFDLIKRSPVIKNPYILYESKINDLNKIREKNFFKNPYLLLDSSVQRLEVCREKLDKISQVIELKKEQKRQKSTYMKIIIAIIVILIIMILLLYGGI